MEDPEVEAHEVFEAYSKGIVIEDLPWSRRAERKPAFPRRFMCCKGRQTLVLGLGDGWQTSRNHTCLQQQQRLELAWNWNLRGSQNFNIGIPSTFLVFVRGEFVEGTSAKGDQFLCLGLVGLHSLVSSTAAGPPERLLHLRLQDYQGGDAAFRGELPDLQE
jgi:hypothetical protein